MSWNKKIQKARHIWDHSGWSGLRQAIGGKLFPGGYWNRSSPEEMLFASWMDFSKEDILGSQALHETYAGELAIGSLSWFLPEFQHPYYGGIHTLLRFADYFKRIKSVDHQFLILGNLPESQVREKIAASFPALAGERIRVFNLYEEIQGVDASDASIATLWGTAYFLLKFNRTRRKFYFIQDYEPLFYPAGSTFAQVEASYRFGYYGIANTPTIQKIYAEQYGGVAEYFLPCVDTQVFHPPDGGQVSEGPVKIFFYGRPAHPRNGFELGAQALRKLKQKLGDRVSIVAAGDRWEPEHYGLEGVVENLGLLGYEETAELYRTCQIGLVMMFTRHPSYLPFEFMASGCLVVTNFNPATTWLLKDGENCRLSEPSASCLADTLEQAVLDGQGRRRITANAVRHIQESFSDWDRQMEKIFAYMGNPGRREAEGSHSQALESSGG